MNKRLEEEAQVQTSSTRAAAQWAPTALILLLGAALLLRATFGSTGHDEDQYLAGAAAAAEGMIFRDFLYLQTPLQAWLFAPLIDLFRPHSFLALRVLTGLIGFATLAVIYAAAREAGCNRLAAGAAIFLVWSTEIFQYASTFLRNDILPTLFFSLALWAAARALKHARPHLWGACGLALGLAVCTKISFALPAAAVALHLLVQAARDGRRLLDLLALIAGGAIAGAPTLLVFAAAPENFLYGTLYYHAAAPFDWYAVNGLQEKLSFAGKAREFLSYLAQGPALVMVAVVLGSRFLCAGHPDGKESRLFFGLVLLASAVAAWLPTPSWPPYLVLMLPPLAVQFGLCLQRLLSADASALRRRAVIACLMLTAPLGWLQGIAIVRTALAHEPPVVSMTKQAHWLGKQLASCRAQGRVASFTARWVIDSGYRLDPRFAPGVFAFRSGHLLTAAQAQRSNVIVPQTAASQFDAAPPAAIVIGDQMRSDLFSVHPDHALLNYATSRGWTRLDHPDGDMSVFVAPAFDAGPCRRAVSTSQ